MQFQHAKFHVNKFSKHFLIRNLHKFEYVYDSFYSTIQYYESRCHYNIYHWLMLYLLYLLNYEVLWMYLIRGYQLSWIMEETQVRGFWIRGFEVLSIYISGNFLFVWNQISWFGLPKKYPMNNTTFSVNATCLRRTTNCVGITYHALI